MGTEWTKEQKEVICLRDHSMLVSAAAGSGKTAVLIERILGRITDPDRPVDVDRLLIVTFTRAAAEEMKERLGRALDNALAADPGNDNLQKQSQLLHHAQINTIHGFCSHVIQNYYYMIGLDPGYRLAEEDELGLLEEDVLKELLEEEYQAASPAFLQLMDAFSPGRSDSTMISLIRRICAYALSAPDPAAWLQLSLRQLQAETPEELENCDWFREIERDTDRQLEELIRTYRQEEKVAAGPGGPLMYLPQLVSDREQAETILQAEGYEERQRLFASLQFATLGRKKKEMKVDPQLQERVKESRNRCKSRLQAIQDRYRLPMQEILKETAVCAAYQEELIRLSQAFLRRFGEEKRNRNMLDYSDLEHFALEILLDEKGEPSSAARELSEGFEEIMTDEYQDSNAVQEQILEAVSGKGRGLQNRFMVGDIKQAIYGFRMARPDLFLEKYEDYASGEQGKRRIDLSSNFRSRAEVLACCNVLFQRLMQPGLGGIEYDAAARLYPGAEYLPSPHEGFAGCELLLADWKSAEFDEDRSDEQKLETEALMIAHRIRRMIEEGEQVYDRDSRGFRPLTYRDCVILLRSTSGRAETFVQTLQNAGIPAFAASGSGYFAAYEVMTVLELLRILDNPRQEIPYAAILRSPIVGCTDTELAMIRTAIPKVPIYEAAQQYADLPTDRSREEAALTEKLRDFLNRLESYRKMVPVLPVHELIDLLLEETGFGSYAAAMPGGEQRSANLRLLREKALAFEKTSYHGLFQFIRYIEQLKKHGVDYGEVSLADENADTVRIMTIHKSKGLEFPVVFLAGLHKEHNLMDLRQPVVLHSRLGMGLHYVDTERRIRRSSLQRDYIAEQCRMEQLGEELRILYVAVTRAKEKLILTGVAKDLAKTLAGTGRLPAGTAAPLPLSAVGEAHSYLEWVLAAFADQPAMESLYAAYAAEGVAGCQAPAGARSEALPLRVRLVTRSMLEEKEVVRMAGRALGSLGIPLQEGRIFDSGLRSFLEQRAAWTYPHGGTALPQSLSVSELKRRALEASEEDPSQQLYEEGAEAEGVAGKNAFPLPEEPEIPKARFQRAGESAVGGAARGTVYHRVFECLDYSRWESPEDLERQLEEMEAAGKLGKGEKDCIRPGDLERFRCSDLGKRMKAAALRGQLHREQPFLMQLPAAEALAGWPSDETVQVQGIIDAWFEEEGRVILVDYKTDRVWDDGNMLAEKYRPQLALYSMAMDRGQGRRPEEIWIYSTGLGKEISVQIPQKAE